MSADLFVSYASADRERVVPIVDALEAAGFSCWIDFRNIAGGAEWNSEIVQAIKSCRVVLIMCSAASMRSHNVRQEIRLAWSPGVRYIPVLLEDIGRSFPDQVSYFLEGFQWVDGSKGDSADWMPRLLSSIESALHQGTSPEPKNTLDLPEQFLNLLQTSRLTDTIWPEPYSPNRQPVISTRDLGEAPQAMQHAFRIGDFVQLVIESDRDGHLLLIDIGTSGKVYCLCPSAFCPDTRIRTGRNILPSPDSKISAFQASGLPGREELLAIISDEPSPITWHQGALAIVLDLRCLESLLNWLNSLTSVTFASTYFSLHP